MTTRRSSNSSRCARKLAALGSAALAALLASGSPSLAQFAGKASLVSVSSTGVLANANSRRVAVSGDGRIVAFASNADNLVPLDTNDDSDVFVHDAVTRITSRISVNYQGEEAQGDSDCPSISADGRWVAFRSRAWNMRQGAENLGTPVWEVYVHDRQEQQTIRVSTPLEGGAGSADSGCPQISADGSRVAFSSSASDLVPDDTNGVDDIFVADLASEVIDRVSVADDEAEADGAAYDPTISADGTIVAFTSVASNLTPDSALLWMHLREQVYLRDLSAGTTELISVALGSPIEPPNGKSCCAEMSADGRVVVFLSYAVNLATGAKTHLEPLRLFLRDRAAATTDEVDSLALGPITCTWFSMHPRCRDSSWVDGAAISGDGRFVAYLSGSFWLVPENPPFHQDQIVLLDLLTRRVRRLTVDPTGYPIEHFPCGASSSSLALSADGSVLAFAGENVAALGLPEATVTYQRDAVRLEWTCDEDGHCRELSTCPAAPATTCSPASSSNLRIRRNPPLAPRRERFSWRWVGDPGVPPFADPAEADYQLCVYAGERMTAQIDAGVPSSGAWKRVEGGWRRKERHAAVEGVMLRNGQARSTITVTSSSPALDLPYLPLDASNGVTVQLHESTSGHCWEAAFPESALLINQRGAVGAGGTQTGIVYAKIR